MQAARVRPGAAPSGGRRDAPLLTRLRTTTADAHLRVENRLFPSALADRDSYGRLLRVLLALHEPVEQRLLTLTGLPALGIDPAQRRKAPWLRADLSSLGIGSLPQPPGRSVVSGNALPEALGAFYVLEGSTLGGRVLLDQVRTRLGGVPTRFLSGYGADTARYWRRTRTALVQAVHTDVDPAGAGERLIEAARATFEYLDRLLDEADWAAP